MVMIGHVSAETTLNIYSHVTNNMRAQAAARKDRKTVGIDTPIPDAPPPIPPQPQTREIEAPISPYTPKIRKNGTGCIYQVNANLWEGSFYPRLPNGKRTKFNVYAPTREEAEEKLAVLIQTKKAKIAEMKRNQTNN